MRRLLSLSVFLAFSVAVQADDLYRFETAEPVIAFGDVHGAYNELIDLLRATGVIDASGSWRAGKSHVVSLGDLLDRGPSSRQVMDLLMQLQEQAKRAGGRVHVVLGNHEMMNLVGDLRYVSPGEFAAFAADESPVQRDLAFAEFSKRFVSTEQAEAEFSQRFPPGYFALRDAFSPTGHYGRWLLQLPVIIVVNDTAYTHGGIPPMASTYNLDQLNKRLTADLQEFVGLWHQLHDLNLFSFELSAEDAAIELQKLSEGDQPLVLDDAAQLAVDRFIELSRSAVLNTAGPLWYRGSALCHPALETDVLQVGLTNLRASRVVVGHTPTTTRRAVSRLDGRILMLDTGMLASYYNGTAAALVSRPLEEQVFYPQIPGLRQPEAQQWDNAGGFPGGISGLSQVLLNAKNKDSGTANEQGLHLIDSRAGVSSTTVAPSTAIPATVLVKRFRGRDARNAIAAYELDRLLGLGIVPVAASTDGSNTLQYHGDDWVSEPARVASQQPVANWCGRGHLFDLLYLLDALALVDIRDPETIYYSDSFNRIWVTDFSASFSTRDALPVYLSRHLETSTLALSPELKARLQKLDEPTLSAALGEYLGKRQLRAVLKRRDRILETWEVRTVATD